MNRPGHFILFAIALFTTYANAATAYSPMDAICPPSALVRKASGLSDRESDWISQRDEVTRGILIEWLNASNLNDFDAAEFFNNDGMTSKLRLGLAFSGGGYRAMLSGAGMLAALDSRTEGACEKGGLGGLLQGSSYITGLSGGSWLVGSVAGNGFATIESLQNSKYLWNFQNVFNPTPAKSGILGRIELDWTLQIVEDVLGKQLSGFPVSLTDVWGRYLSAQTFGDADHGKTLHWSSLLNSDAIRDHTMPLPIILCDSLVNNQSQTVSLNSTMYEVSPYEFGSWDPTVYSFIETEYLGSYLSDSIPDSNRDCVTGYDNIGFLIGASSTLFNQMVRAALQESDILRSLYNDILKRFHLFDIESAIIGANPFYKINYVWDPIESSSTIQLVDGGEDGENIPLSPLLQSDREVDVILAFDNSADDTHNWPQGRSLVYTYQRQFSPQGNGTIFPFIPEMSEFDRLRLAEQPVFFGCDVNNEGDYDQPEADEQPPLVIYIANSKHSYASNFSTFKVSYNNTERDSMINNGYNIITQNNGTLDSSWRTCLACSLILREQQRRGQSPSEQCSECFSRYCYEAIAMRNTKSREAAEDDNQVQTGTGDSPVHTKSGSPGDRSQRDERRNIVDQGTNLTTDKLGYYEKFT